MMVNKPAFSVCSTDKIVAFVMDLHFYDAKIQHFLKKLPFEAILFLIVKLLYKFCLFRHPAERVNHFRPEDDTAQA